MEETNINEEILNDILQTKNELIDGEDLKNTGDQEFFKENKKVKKNKSFTKLDLLKISENQDVEAFYPQDFESTAKFDSKYYAFYDDVKQPNKYIKEDW